MPTPLNIGELENQNSLLSHTILSSSSNFQTSSNDSFSSEIGLSQISVDSDIPLSHYKIK